VVIANCLFSVFEGLQASAGFLAFLSDPWNYFEVITPLLANLINWIQRGKNQDELDTDNNQEHSICLL